jgi:hypothetical protein
VVLKTRIASFLAVLALAGTVGVSADATAKPTVTYEDTTAYVIDGVDPAYPNANLSALNEYYYYAYTAIAAWNADADGAETWGGTAVTLVPASSCPAATDYCIYATQGSFTALGDSDSSASFGEYYPEGTLGAGIGERGYVTLNTDLSSSEEQRMTFTTHEFGHALGIGYDSSTDSTDLMSDVVEPTVQGITYAEFQTVGQRTK